MDHGEFASPLTPLAASTALLAHPVLAEPFDRFLSSLPACWMMRDLSTGIWHASDRCRRLTTPFAHVQLSLTDLPDHTRPCPTCSSWLAEPFGRALAVFASALLVDSQPLDWPGLAARRRFILDPLASFDVRVNTQAPLGFYDNLRLALEPILDSLAHIVALTAPQLDPAPLYDCLADPTSETTMAYLSRVHPYDTAPPPRSSVPSDLTGTETFLELFAVSGGLRLFCEGSPLQRVLDLFAARAQLTPTGLRLAVPVSLVTVLKATKSTAFVEVLPEDSPDVLRFADRLFMTSPARGLASALSVARRLVNHGAS